MYDILNVPKTRGVVLWLDDRNLSGYQHSQGNPLIGVLEVLKALHQAKLISEPDKYHFLLQLRNSNALFIPFTACEIIHHLNKATIKDGKVVETPALAVFRRNFARISLMEDHLKIGESDPQLQGRPQEIEFLIHMQRVVPNCIIAQWSSAKFSEAESHPRASWLWSSLRIERYYRVPIGASEPELSCMVLGLTISALLTGILQLTGRNDSLSRLKSYVRWLNHEIFDYRVKKDSCLQDMLVRHLSLLMTQVVADAGKLRREDLGYCKLLMRTIVQQLPEDLRQRLIADGRFCSELGIKTTDTVNVSGLSFQTDAFWKAIVRALASGQAHVQTVKDQHQVKLTRVANQKDAIRMSGLKVVLHDPAFGLLCGSPVQRRKLLLSNSQWLDMPVEKRGKVIEGIISIGSPAERIEALRSVRDGSPAFSYASLEQRLASHEELRIDAFLPPSATNLLSHLRLFTDLGVPFPDRLERAAEALISEGGWQFAFSRLAGLPVPLPDQVSTAFLALNEPERQAAAENLIVSCITPLQILHTLYLFNLAIDKGGRTYFDRLLNLAFQRWSDVAKLFVEVLRWSDVAYQDDDTALKLDVSDRLALVWTHADRVSAILVRNQVDCGLVAKLFAENHPQRPIEQKMTPDLRFQASPSNPRAVDETGLLFFGMGYVCRGMLADGLLMPEQLQKLVELLLVEVENTRGISPWLYIYRDTKTDSLTSFFRSWPTGAFEDGNAPAEDIVDSLLEKTIEELLADPSSVSKWKHMRVYSTVTLSDERLQKINQALQMIKLVDMVENAGNYSFLPIVAICAARFGNRDSNQFIIEELCRVAAYLSEKSPILTFSSSPKEQPEVAQLWQLVESAAAISQHENVEEALQQFGDIMLRLADAWPSAAAIIREVVDNTVRKVRTVSAKHLWKMFQKVRAM